MNNETILSTANLQTSAPTVRPWVRFFARQMDIMIFTSVLVFFLEAISLGYPNIFLGVNDMFSGVIAILFDMLILFLWVFVEAVFLSTFGATPGKWLLRVTVRDSEGKKLTFLRALRRSFLVWLKGLGIGIPILTAITPIFAYNRLIKRGITSWDRDCHTTVSHQRIGIIRTMIAIGLPAAIFTAGVLPNIFQ